MPARWINDGVVLSEARLAHVQHHEPDGRHVETRVKVQGHLVVFDRRIDLALVNVVVGIDCKQNAEIFPVGHRAHVGAALNGSITDMKLFDIMRVRLRAAAAGRLNIWVGSVLVGDPNEVMLGG
jgi:hypothetical protein